jgi:hypothetical protein
MNTENKKDPLDAYKEACNTVRHYSNASLSVRLASVVQGIALLGGWAVAVTQEARWIVLLLPFVGLAFTWLLYRFHKGYFDATTFFYGVASKMEEAFFEERFRPFAAYNLDHDRRFGSFKGKFLTLNAPFTLVGSAFFVAAIIAVIVFNSQRPFDFDRARIEIQELHRSFIEAHLAEEVPPLVRGIPEDYLFVANGDVQTLNSIDVQQMLQSYFDTATFSHYQDTDKPIIGISADGTFAWAIVQVRVAGTTHRESGTDDPFDTQWAWMTLFEKRNGEWSRIADVSTNRPFTDSE